MSSLVSVLVLIVVALLGARTSFSTKEAPPGPRLLLRTGTHFLLVGFLLGPSALGLLSLEATQGLFPFLALGLGWVGFHFGLQLHRESLRLFPPSYLLLAIGQALIAFVIFAAGALLVCRLVGLDSPLVPLLVLTASCTAAITTPAGIAMISSTVRVRGRIRDLLFFVASLDAVVGVVALQVTYALYRPGALAAGATAFGSLRWIAAAVGLGMICGIVFLWLSRPRPSAEELVLYLLGISAFSAGAALQWGLSPLFVGAIMGAVVANLGPSGKRALPLLERWEKTIYVMFLLLAGALIEFPSWLVLPAALGYAVIRFVSKLAGSAVMVTLLPFRFDIPRTLGLGLIPQGGISIAMAVSAVIVYSGLLIEGADAEPWLFSVIILGVVVSELTAPWLTLSVLGRAGEISADLPANAGRAVDDSGEKGFAHRASGQDASGAEG